MTDRHLRILRLMAQQRQRVLHNYDAVDHTGETGSEALRQRFARAATRTHARLAGAQARRQRHQPDRRS